MKRFFEVTQMTQEFLIRTQMTQITQIIYVTRMALEFLIRTQMTQITQIFFNHKPRIERMTRIISDGKLYDLADEL